MMKGKTARKWKLAYGVIWGADAGIDIGFSQNLAIFPYDVI